MGLSDVGYFILHIFSNDPPRPKHWLFLSLIMIVL